MRGQSFVLSIVYLLLKFPVFTFKKLKGWPISASNTEANSANQYYKVGGFLKFCNTSGGSKNFTHTVGEITKNLQNF